MKPIWNPKNAEVVVLTFQHSMMWRFLCFSEMLICVLVSECTSE
jgi:hypothetical protein